nr:hypothetical protein [Tanacetum cinerariifolium]
MVIDKSWTCLGRHEKAFFVGLKKFVEHCKMLVNSFRNVKCPCKSCRNVSGVSIPDLPRHITNNGWDPSYKTWTNHGEPDVLPLVIHNTTQPQMISDMTTCLNDLSYIPPNNEQNEPTQGDIDETSNEPTQAIRKEFKELYVSANEELYPRSDYVTRLDFMAKFTYFKVKGKLTDSIFNEMLEFFQNAFTTTKGYKLPPSCYAIKKTFKTIRLGYESIHACVNDCFLFWGEDHKDKQFCLVCNTSRWKDSNTPEKKVPKKVLRYFLIIPRLQCLYKSSHTAKEITWHATGKCIEPGLAVDGFNPFGNLSQSYSMWPVILTTYNLPPWLCMKGSSFMLTLLIPGPKSPGKDIDFYLRPLIDDLKDLWAKPSVKTIDVTIGQKFNTRAMVLWTIKDFLARSSLSGWSVQDVMHIEKNMLEGILNTLLMNDKSKDTTKAIQDLKWLGIRSGLWLGQNKNGKCTKPQAAYSFTPGDEKKFCGPIRPQWMYPFESFIKKPKNYVRNKAKPEGLIAEGYVAEEALTSSSYYFRDVTMKFNRPDHSVDFPPLTPEIDMYRVKFKSQFPNKDMKEEFRGWFGSQIHQHHIDKDPGVSASNELFALACGPTLTPILVNSCVVNNVRFVVHNQTTQNNDGQSINVDVPPDIIDVDEDDDIIDDEDVIPHDLTDADDEDLVNVDDNDGVAVVYSSEEEDWSLVMLADVARGHDDDGGDDDRPPLHQLASDCRGKGTRKPNLGGKKAGRMHIRKETMNLGLRKITDELGPQPIRFEWKDNGTMLPLDPDILQTSLRKIRMSRSSFGLVPRTWPSVLKMLETRQRAWSYAGRDPGHLLPSEISRVRVRIRGPSSRSMIYAILAESPFTLDSTPTYVDESPNIFNPPPQPLVNPCEFYGNDAYYGHYCTPQSPFIYPD